MDFVVYNAAHIFSELRAWTSDRTVFNYETTLVQCGLYCLAKFSRDVVGARLVNPSANTPGDMDYGGNSIDCEGELGHKLELERGI